MWGGLAFRSQSDLSALVGVSLLENNELKLGYAFDFTVSNSQAKSPTSHEIMLGYVLPPISKKVRPVIHSPRFHFE